MEESSLNNLDMKLKQRDESKMTPNCFSLRNTVIAKMHDDFFRQRSVLIWADNHDNLMVNLECLNATT